MGSRLKTDPKHLYECFFEVAGPSDDEPSPHTVAKYPSDFSDDVVVKELPRFCFPCDLSRFNPAGQLFTFVLTGIDNLQRFGFCRHPPGAKTAICFLSYLPWFDIFYKVLNKLANLRYSCEPAFTALLEQLYEVDIPSPGKQFRIRVSDGESSSDVTYNVPDMSRDLPSIPENINMTEYFSAVTPENMIILFASLLHERRVLITSDRLHRLTACVHGSASMLHPLHWQHIYIPVTPSHLIDYCSAPMPFLIGVHSSFMEQVRRMALDEVVILDADNNTVETPFDDVQSLPSEAVNQLKHNLKNSSQVYGDGVARAFLKTIVSLLGSYREALMQKDGSSQLFFDRDAFLSNGSKHEIAFRNSVLQLQHFSQFVDSRVDALNQDQAVDDLFEEELTRGASGSKVQEHIKRKLHQAKNKAKATSSHFYGQLKTTTQGAKDKVIQANIKVPNVNVNSQAIRDAFSQTKKKMTTMKGKLGSKETEDILNRKKITPPITSSRSTPTSPSSSPVLPRKKNSSQSVFRPRTFMLPSSSSSQPKDKNTDKRGTRHYDVLEIDQKETMSLEEALRDDALLPSRYNNLDLMPSVKPILERLDRTPPSCDEEDVVSQGSRGGTPQPPPRRRRDDNRDGEGDEVSLRSNNSSSSLQRMDVSTSDGSSSSQGSGLLPPPPSRSRPRNLPPPPPPPTYQQSTNNSNQINLIDITTDSPESDDMERRSSEGGFADNFTGGRRGSTSSNISVKRETLGQQLLEEYGLNFEPLSLSRPGSFFGSGSSLGSAPGSAPGQAPTSLRSTSPVPTSSHPWTEPVQNSSGLANILAAPPLLTVSDPSSAWTVQGTPSKSNPFDGTSSQFKPLQGTSSRPNPFGGPATSSQANPFSSSKPTVPQKPPVNPFRAHAPLVPTKSMETAAQPQDPFAALVNIQKTNISPVSKEFPHAL